MKAVSTPGDCFFMYMYLTFFGKCAENLLFLRIETNRLHYM